MDSPAIKPGSAPCSAPPLSRLWWLHVLEDDKSLPYWLLEEVPEGPVGELNVGPAWGCSVTLFGLTYAELTWERGDWKFACLAGESSFDWQKWEEAGEEEFFLDCENLGETFAGGVRVDCGESVSTLKLQKPCRDVGHSESGNLKTTTTLFIKSYSSLNAICIVILLES